MTKKVAVVKKKSASRVKRPSKRVLTIPAQVKHKCDHKGCKRLSVVMKRYNGEPKRFCGEHWVKDVEATPRFKKAMKRHAEFMKTLNTKPKKKIVRKKKMKAKK